MNKMTVTIISIIIEIVIIFQAYLTFLLFIQINSVYLFTLNP